ncbi:MAG: type II secretion system F family protein [Epsilonproteobacteria bacterium]|nr:type II secretion system F family protein [Campylobacterota bacterium]
MPLYRYDAFAKDGKRVSGSIDAPTPQAAKEALKIQALMPVSIKEVTADGGGFSLAMLFEKKVEAKTVIIFTRQLGVLLKSAVPLLQALELLIEQFEGRFRRILISVKDGVKSGESLASQLANYPKIFSNVYIQLVRAGEATGKLDTILFRLTDYLERTEATKKKVKKAMSYPIMMISFAVAVVVGLMTSLVPKFKDVFGTMGVELPGITQVLIVSSDFMLDNFLLIVVGTIALIGLFMYWSSRPQGKYKLDEFFLRFPMTAYFSRTRAVVQFSQTLGMLLESGVNLAEALDIVCNIIENRVLAKKLLEARDKIIKEGKIAKYLTDSGLFPKIASYMISTGEQSGKLSEMLLVVGRDYEEELNELTESLVAKINPVMTLVLGAVVGFIVLAIFLPIMELTDVFAKLG